MAHGHISRAVKIGAGSPDWASMAVAGLKAPDLQGSRQAVAVGISTTT